MDRNILGEPFHPTTFAKNREWLLEADVARWLHKEAVREACRRRLELTAGAFNLTRLANIEAAAA